MNGEIASSDKNNGVGLLPAAVVWRASQLARQIQDQSHSTETEPEPLELIGLTIGILRRRKRLSHLQFATKIGCSVEELLVLESGLLSDEKLVKYLPAVICEIGDERNIIQMLVSQIKFA
ncbi:MAG: hypothetical protein HYZ25_16130 [Chloroflexi bacterium]|nr:hypothetical protein [Chloroflexota bacterium]